MKRSTPEMDALLRATASQDPAVARTAYLEMAKALTIPLRQGVLKGDIIGDIFEEIPFQPGQATEFPLDFLAPSTESEFVAYTIPNVGRIPERHVEADYIMVPTFDVGCSIDWSLKYSRDARWDIVGRAMQVLEASFVRKNNDDGWHVIITAGINRNLLVYDSQATAGLFTKRLVALMITTMRRNAGGNTTSINQGRLTDLYLSPEALEDMRSWDLSQVDPFTQRDIFIAPGDPKTNEMSLTKIFGVEMHVIDELGVGSLYGGTYFTAQGGALTNSKTEICVGLDLYNRDAFVRPVRQEVEIFEDPTFHRQRRAGLYGSSEGGWACCDARRVLLGEL